MRLKIEIEVDDSGPSNEPAAVISNALVRYANGLAMIGAVPSLSPLWGPGGKRVGRAWTDDVDVIATVAAAGGAA